MKLKTTLLALAAASALTALAVPAAQAEDSVFVPLFTYRTGPFAGSGILIADGMHDYLTMLNERDGGIGGVKIAVEECETGYDTKKGLECYEAVKPKNPVMVNPWSTGLWSLGLGARRHVPLDFQSAGHLLGRLLADHQVHRRTRRRARQAQGQEDRLHLS